MDKGGPDTHETTQESTYGPPEYVEPYIQDALSAAQSLYQTTPLYPSTTIDPTTMSGIQSGVSAAQNPSLIDPTLQYTAGAIGGQYLAPQDPGSMYSMDVLGGGYLPTDRLGQEQLQATARGDYLTPSALTAAAQPSIDMALQGVRSGFEGAGGTGGSMEAMASAEGVTRALANQYNIERANQMAASGMLEDEYARERAAQAGAAGQLTGQYLTERELQQQASALAPGAEQFRYLPSQQLTTLGQLQTGLETQYYQEPWERLGAYTGLALGGAPAQMAGGTSTGTSQQPIYYPSPFQSMLGFGTMLGGFF